MLTLYGKSVSAAFPYGKPAHRGVELPQVAGGSSPAYPTSGSLLLRAKDRLRLFRKLFKKVLSKMLRSPPREGHPATVGLCIKLFRKKFYQKPVSLVKLSF
jgi:hypothetical protein